MEVAKIICPHRKQKIVSSPTSWRSTLGSPLKNCPLCNGYYLMPDTFEWSINGPFAKFFYCFIANGRWAFLLVIFNRLSIDENSAALIWLIAWILFSIFRLIIFDRKKIKASYRRTKDNPEYTKKLNRLGYMSFDYIFDSYL